MKRTTKMGNVADFFERGRTLAKMADQKKPLPEVNLITFEDPVDTLTISVENPLAAARARGADYKAAELANPENLSLDQAAARAGYPEAWINALHQRGELYALGSDWQDSEYRYPEWQFDAERERLVPVLEALAKSNVGCWGIHSFMHTPSQDIEDLTPRDWILRQVKPLKSLLNAVERLVAQDQGAQ